MVVDSSVFLEIIANGPLRAKCEKAISGRSVFVPTLVLFEVYRKLKSKLTEHDALDAVASLRQFKVLELTAEVALGAGDLSLEHKLAMADSFMLAHARQIGIQLLTLDNNFADIPGVIILR